MENMRSEVVVSCLDKSGEIVQKFDAPVVLSLGYDPQGLSVSLKQDKTQLCEFPISCTTECARIGPLNYVITIDEESFFFKFQDVTDARNFHAAVAKVKYGKGISVFTERTEEASASQYFQFYSYLSQQQNMMQDYIRTSTYQHAILSNLPDFRDKIVLDVGAGSGILSFFAAQAGARHVYAVEGSNIAQHAATLVTANNMADRITVIAGKIEEIALPEDVDVIISEPMGFMLYNERMLETYLHAKKWLRPGGKMYPTRGDLHVAPFTDDALYVEQFTKANFWYHQSFHGVDLSSLREAAMKEYFRQPIVDTFDIRICTARSVRHVVNFQSADEKDLHRIEIPLYFEMLQSGSVHGLAFWFDVAFIGSVKTVWLSTSPTEPLTHWYQVRCLLETPVFCVAGQVLTGQVVLAANQRQSYDVTMKLQLSGSNQTFSNTLDLKNPYFRYPGATVETPAEVTYASPSETYWTQLDQARQQEGSTDITLEPCDSVATFEVYR